MKERLFLFTKQFPYGNMEQYIAHEIPYLAGCFDEIILVPTDLFDFHSQQRRNLPQNVSVLEINKYIELHRTSRLNTLWATIKFVVFELFHSQSFLSTLKRIKKHFGYFLHIYAMSNVFTKLINEKYAHSKNYYYSYWLYHAIVMLAILKEKGIVEKIIARGHALDLYNEDWDTLPKIPPHVFQQLKFYSADKIFVISKHGLNYCKKKYPNLSQKFELAYLGVPDNGLNPAPSPSDTFTIVSVSHLSSNKRMRYMTKILQQLSFPVQWFHFGDGEEKKIILSELPHLNKNIKIHLVGHESNEEIMQFFKSQPINLFINLSYIEGLPVSLMEAASFGIPLIATDVYGSPEIVIPNNTGFLVPRNFTIEELSKIISELHHNYELQIKLRKGAREHYLKYFNAPTNYSQFAENIKKVYN